MRADNAVIGFYICSITSGNVFSRDALSRLLASFNPRGGIDASPALAMPYLGEIISLSRPLAYYRVHDNSMSDWANPTTARLRRELQNFRMMWAEVASALGMNAIPFVESRREPVFVSERAVMIACDEGHVFPAPQVWRYVRGLASSHITKRHKFAFSAWALLLLLPSKKLRKYFVRVKRSPVNRPRGLQAVLGILSRRAARNISVYP
jgi:hypothetical protein